MPWNWGKVEPQGDQQRMIEDQLVARGIQDPRILEAFRTIPRIHFMPLGTEHEAYADYPTHITCGQTISQPFIVALMMEYLQITPDSRLLEVGTGSGYSTALLAQMAKSVDSVELYEELMLYAQERLAGVPHDNIRLFLGSGWQQMPTGDQYDRIIVWASAAKVPDALVASLSGNGKMVIPVGKMDQYVYVIRKTGDTVEKQRLDAVRFVPLVREDQEPEPFRSDDDSEE